MDIQTLLAQHKALDSRLCNMRLPAEHRVRMQASAVALAQQIRDLRNSQQLQEATKMPDPSPATTKIVAPVPSGRATISPHIAKAIELAALGFHVVPARDKKTLPLAWQKLATNDVEKIPALWEANPGYPEVSIFTGRFGEDKALVVIDVDPRHGGDATLAKFKADNPDVLTKTRVHKTPSGGLHYIYVVDQPIKQGTNVIGKGIDTRSAGGQIFFGKQYKLLAGGAPTEGSPALLSHVAKSKPAPILATPVEVPNDVATQEALNYLESLEPVGEGKRNDSLYKAAAKLHGIGVEHDTALALISEHFPYSDGGAVSDSELATIVGSAFKTAQNAPGSESIVGYFPNLGAAEHLPVALQKGVATQDKIVVKLRPMLHARDIQVREAWDQPYIVKRWIGRGQDVQLFGETGVGKTFIVLDLGARIASGERWHSERVTQTPALLLLYEGLLKIDIRLSALRKEHPGWPWATMPYAVQAMTAPIITARGKAQLKESLGRFKEVHGVYPELIVIDTLSRALGTSTSDEEAAMRFEGLIADLRETISKLLTVMWVHHPGHVEKDRGRGAYAVVAAADVDIKVEENAILGPKQRDDQSDARKPFSLKVVTLGTDQDGDEITTCVATDHAPGDTMATSPADREGARTLLLEALDRYTKAGQSTSAAFNAQNNLVKLLEKDDSFGGLNEVPAKLARGVLADMVARGELVSGDLPFTRKSSRHAAEGLVRGETFTKLDTRKPVDEPQPVEAPSAVDDAERAGVGDLL
jgi:AAA domain/Bifunctional DNA primase/polymerase, N-terminal